MESHMIEEMRTRRMLWRCRRGLLELDLVLAEFVRQHYPHLTRRHALAFEQLLDYGDNELWGLVTGLEANRDKDHRQVLELLRKARRV